MSEIKQYFSYDPLGDGFVLHSTEEKAKRAAEDALAADCDEAVDEGWSEESMSVCWGEVREVVEAIQRDPCEIECCDPCTGKHRFDSYEDRVLVKPKDSFDER